MNKKVNSQFKRISDKLRYGLVLQVIRNRLARIGIEITPYYWIETVITNSPIPEIEGKASDYSVEFLESKDMRIIAENSHGYSEQEFLLRIKKGKKCLALKQNDEIVTFLWINLNECDFKPINMPLEKGEAYLAEMYTTESNRGKNFAPFLRRRSYEILKGMGKERLFSVTEFFNSSALKYIQKTNAKKLKLILYIRLFKKFKWSCILKTY